MTVTTSRAIFPGATYAMQNVTSVRTLVGARSPVAIVFGMMFLVGGGSCGGLATLGSIESGKGGALNVVGLVFGLLMLALGAWLAILMFVRYSRVRPKRWVCLGTSGGEVRAVMSRNAAWVHQVVSAVSQVIESRG